MAGKIYEMSGVHYKDDDCYIRRVRRTPHLSHENLMLFFSRLEVIVEAGRGLDGASTTQGTDPMMIVRWSDDGGKTWSNEEFMSMGKIGEWRWRIKLTRLGKARDRVFELIITEPIPVRIIDGLINFKVGKEL